MHPKLRGVFGPRRPGGSDILTSLLSEPMQRSPRTAPLSESTSGRANRASASWPFIQV